MEFREYRLLETKADIELIDRIVKEYDVKIINEFLNNIQAYMKFNDKYALKKIEQLSKEYPLLQSFKAKKVFRIMAVPKGSNPENGISFDNFSYISTSTAKLVGKTLIKIADDNLDRYEHYNKSEGEMVYLEFENAEGINIYEIVKQTLNKTSTISKIVSDSVKDTFVKLKSEKEFMIINKELNPVNIEKVDI